MKIAAVKHKAAVSNAGGAPVIIPRANFAWKTARFDF